jgi:putative membrane protein
MTRALTSPTRFGLNLLGAGLVMAALVLTPMDGTAQSPKATGDAQILGWLIALNENEVSAATAAEQKASTAGKGKFSDEVLTFAKMLHVQHAKGAQDTKELAARTGIMPVENAEVERMRAKAKQDQAHMAPLPTPEFERAFVTMMANGHREALRKVEGFLKTAQHDALKQHLSATRDRVQMHLADAERLQKTATH